MYQFVYTAKMKLETKRLLSCRNSEGCEKCVCSWRFRADSWSGYKCSHRDKGKWCTVV